MRCDDIYIYYFGRKVCVRVCMCVCLTHFAVKYQFVLMYIYIICVCVFHPSNPPAVTRLSIENPVVGWLAIFIKYEGREWCMMIKCSANMRMPLMCSVTQCIFKAIVCSRCIVYAKNMWWAVRTRYMTWLGCLLRGIASWIWFVLRFAVYMYR